MSIHPLIQCDISATVENTDLMTKIITACANESGAAVHCTPTVSTDEDTILLHLPVEFAGAQHPVWCLVCRLACYFPSARVSVLVHGESAFSSQPSREALSG